MIIQKGVVKAIFHERGLQITPDVIPALDRHFTRLFEQWAKEKAAQGFKRLKPEDILLTNGLQTPVSERSGPEAGKGTQNAISPKIIEDNPSKITGPCSRCVGIHDRVIRIAREIEVQINEGAIAIYKEKLRDF